MVILCYSLPIDIWREMTKNRQDQEVSLNELISSEGNLLVLIDISNSMHPFSPLIDGVCATMQNAREDAKTYYFDNAVINVVYESPYQIGAVSFDSVLDDVDKDTSVLIISDAGAARGYRVIKRIRATTQFGTRLKERTNIEIKWLNPVPNKESCWDMSSAAIISHLYPMYFLADVEINHLASLSPQSPKVDVSGDWQYSVKIPPSSVPLTMEYGKRKIETFVRCYTNPNYLMWAMVCAVPCVITPMLINELRHRFMDDLVDPNAEADILLSELFRVIGYQQYRMDEDVRAYLLNQMTNGANDWTDELTKTIAIYLREVQESKK